MKTFNMVKNILKTLEITSDRGLVLQFFEGILNLVPIGVLCSAKHVIVKRWHIMSCTLIITAWWSCKKTTKHNFYKFEDIIPFTNFNFVDIGHSWPCLLFMWYDLVCRKTRKLLFRSTWGWSLIYSINWWSCFRNLFTMM